MIPESLVVTSLGYDNMVDVRITLITCDMFAYRITIVHINHITSLYLQC